MPHVSKLVAMLAFAGLGDAALAANPGNAGFLGNVSSLAGNRVVNGDFAKLSPAAGNSNAPNQIVRQPSARSQGTGNSVSIDGWTIGNASSGLNFAFVYRSGDATRLGASGAPGRDGQIYLWGDANPSPNSLNGFDGTAPRGSNFLAADSDGPYAPSFSQTIGDLVVGKTYVLSFDWAAAQFRNGRGNGFNGASHSQWNVSFGSDSVATPVLNIGSHGFSGWQHAIFSFTAKDVNEQLRFLASGGPGGLPPAALLTNVALTDAIPEPASWALLVIGFAGLGTVLRRRRIGPLSASAAR